MITISPSLLACDFLNLENEINKLNKLKNIWIHLDVMDGHFVPNLTFGHEIIKRISEKSTNPIDVHLMVNNPHFYIETLKDFGVFNITWHLENNVDHIELIKIAKKYYKSVGISIRPNTSVKDIPLEILPLVDLILVMSVEPGFGGQSFMDNSIVKCQELKKLKDNQNLKYIIQIDGGISDLNSKSVTKAGAENLVAGSYIFKSNDYNNQILKLIS